MSEDQLEFSLDKIFILTLLRKQVTEQSFFLHFARRIPDAENKSVFCKEYAKRKKDLINLLIGDRYVLAGVRARQQGEKIIVQWSRVSDHFTKPARVEQKIQRGICIDDQQFAKAIAVMEMQLLLAKWFPQKFNFVGYEMHKTEYELWQTAIKNIFSLRATEGKVVRFRAKEVAK